MLLLGLLVLFATVLAVSWYWQAPTIVEGCYGSTASQASVLAAQEVSENLAMLTQQLAAQSAEMRAMRQVVAALRQEHQLAVDVAARHEL